MAGNSIDKPSLAISFGVVLFLEKERKGERLLRFESATVA